MRPARRQPAFHRDRPAGLGQGAVRAALLRAGRGREPDQGLAAASVWPARKLRSLPGQSAALAAGRAGRAGQQPDDHSAPAGPAGHRTGQSLHRHDPHQAAQDRAGILRNTRRVRVLLASAQPIRHVFIAAARAGRLNPIPCWPRHPDKQRGHGEWGHGGTASKIGLMPQRRRSVVHSLLAAPVKVACGEFPGHW